MPAWTSALGETHPEASLQQGSGLFSFAAKYLEIETVSAA